MSYMNKQLNKESLMEYWYFSDQEKEILELRKEFDDVDEYEAGEKIRSWIEQG